MKTIPELDGVRALAIAPVLALHGSYGHIPGGFLGVDLFFVLSGFLITKLLVDEYVSTAAIDIGSFYLRRACRILPPLVIGVVLGGTLSNKGDLGSAIPAIVFFYANLVDPHTLGVMTHTWSLSIEEQFYLIWPVTLVLLLRRTHGLQLAAVALAIAVLASLLVRVALWGAHFSPDAIYRCTAARADSLSLGCLTAVLQAQKRIAIPNAVTLLAFLGICLAFLFCGNSNAMLVGGYSAFGLICAVFIAGVTTSPNSSVRQLLRTKALRYVGRRSYALYVYHLPIFAALEPLRETRGIANFLAITSIRIVVTWIAAELSFRLVESPFLTLKDRYSRKSPA